MVGVRPYPSEADLDRDAVRAVARGHEEAEHDCAGQMWQQVMAALNLLSTHTLTPTFVRVDGARICDVDEVEGGIRLRNKHVGYSTGE